MRYNTIAISGLPGSGKGTLARVIAKKLNWKLFSIGDIWRERWKDLYPKAEISFEDYWKKSSFEEQKKINDKARKIISSEKIVGEFRYAICCKGLPTLFVFVKADLKNRAQRALQTKKYPEKSLEDIKQILSGREKDEVEWGKRLFGRDYDYRDLDHYEIILDSSKLTIEEEFEIVDRKLKQ